VGIWWEGEDTLVVVDNYLNKTGRNLEANSQVAFVGWDGETRRNYRINGRAEILKEGPIYEKGHKRAAGRERPLPGKAVVVAVEEVFEAMGGRAREIE
jgi:predicted pyridoxine 5'-phosphate oxidase superfamily flavin-nucleotide-binding protein